ncbi:hypothetical protein OKW34_005953 [Paraburkholderia youngii]
MDFRPNAQNRRAGSPVRRGLRLIARLSRRRPIIRIANAYWLDSWPLHLGIQSRLSRSNVACYLAALPVCSQSLPAEARRLPVFDNAGLVGERWHRSSLDCGEHRVRLFCEEEDRTISLRAAGRRKAPAMTLEMPPSRHLIRTDLKMQSNSRPFKRLLRRTFVEHSTLEKHVTTTFSKLLAAGFAWPGQGYATP